MRYLLVILLLAQPSLALMSSAEANNRAYMFNKAKVATQLPILLKLVEKKIEAASTIGQYEIQIDIEEYDESVIIEISDILSREGYHIDVYKGYPLGLDAKLLNINWQ